MTVGEKIRDVRTSQGLSKAELARRLGVTYQSVGQWEDGKRVPKRETLEKIASALGVPVNELTLKIGEDDNFAQVELETRYFDIMMRLSNAINNLTPEGQSLLYKYIDFLKASYARGATDSVMLEIGGKWEKTTSADIEALAQHMDRIAENAKINAAQLRTMING